MTDARVDPKTFNHGIGKDRISSIDEPAFASQGDPRLTDAHIDDDALVIGYAQGGEARAYPIAYLNRHELVNDTFGEAHVTVAW